MAETVDCLPQLIVPFSLNRFITQFEELQRRNLIAANSFSLIWTEVNACLFWARKFKYGTVLFMLFSASGCLECRWSPGTLFKPQVEDVKTSISMDPSTIIYSKNTILKCHVGSHKALAASRCCALNYRSSFSIILWTFSDKQKTELYSERT